MASRSSAGVGVGITITILGVVCLALFVTTIIFLSKYNATTNQARQRDADQNVFVRTGEAAGADFNRYKDLAQKSGGKSVFAYLHDSLQTAMARTTGTRSDTADQMAAKLDRIDGASSGPLLGVIADRDRSIADLTARLDQAQRDRTTALTDRDTEARRVAQIQAQHAKTVETLNADIERYKAEVEQYRQRVSDAERFMNSEVEKLRDKLASTEGSLTDRIRNLEGENLQLKDQLATLRGQKKSDILTGRPEESLADGNVISLNGGDNTVTIDRGAKDKIILGMSFAVYSNASVIKPDASGSYPPGKASVEVINVGPTSSTARIVSETKGNPIVRGDVIANAIYDPAKVYTFLVYGNFDSNGDGVATPAETDDIRAMIQGWGGRITDDLSGNVDFLVLGQRPVLPPSPGPQAPLPVVQEYMRLDAAAQRYDLLLRQAASTSVPVLNENRLYTLIGRRGGNR
jgi:hypothetical protein